MTMTEKYPLAVKRPNQTKSKPIGWGARLLRRQLFKMLEGIEYGYLVISDRDGTHCFGSQTAPVEARASVEVYNSAFYTAVAFRGSVGAGEAFMNGYWSCDDLTAAVRIFARNRQLLEDIDTGLRRTSSPIYRTYHRWRRNTRQGSKRNISEHYDLGNQFFSLFLDETMMYSCALFAPGCKSLAEASVAKLEGICQQLHLTPSDHILEIGSGWGGFALYAASHYGCRVRCHQRLSQPREG